MNLIFDFDGTICNSIKPAIIVVNEILSEIGYEKTSVKEVKEKGLKGLIKDRKISIFKINKFVSDYRKKGEKIYETVLPFNGISSVLKILSNKHTLGILTTNKRIIVEKFLDKHKLNFFNFIHSENNIFGKDKVLKKLISKQTLIKEETYYIGDETRDIEAAKKAKVKSIAVSWGAESKKLLTKSNPDIIVAKPNDLLKIWN